MTTNAFSPAPTYTISGPGPYDVPHDYGHADELVVSVILGASALPLDPADYTVVPEGPATAGSVFLTAGAATTYAGETLSIARDTTVSQVWEGLASTARGLEEQLDQMTRGIQDNYLAAGTADAVAIAIAGGTWKASVPDLLQDVALTYLPGGPTSMVAGARIRTLKEGYAYEVADSAATDHHLTTAGGVRLYVLPGPDGSIHVTSFGAIGDGVTDDSVAFQAFFDAIAAFDFGQADISGTFAIGTGLTFGATGAQPATKHIRGRCRLNALAAMDEMLLLTDCNHVEWDTLYLYGTGSTDFASRTCRVGVRFDNCGRQMFRKIAANGFGFAGICADLGNNSLSQFGEVKVTDCGTGKTGYSLTGAWSNPVNSGSAGSTAQRTVIDVTTLPPDYVLAGEYGAVGDAPFFVRIAGRLHFIYSVDVANNRLTVFPWVASTAVPGTFQYVLGGGVYQRGADCNVNGFSAIDAIRCGAGIAASSLYGPKADRVVTQYCGVGILVGRTPNGASLGGNFNNIYFENNDEDIIFVMRTGESAYNYFGAEYALNLSKLYCAGAPRLLSDEISTTYDAFQRQIISLKGELLQYEKASRNATSSSVTLSPRRRDQTLIYRRDTVTFNLEALDVEMNRVTGVDSALLVCMGTGTSQQPTGTVTINPPAGWKINGVVAPLVFTGLKNAPVFSLLWNIGAADVVVTRVNGARAAYVPTATAGSAAEINALRDALVNAGLMAAS